jgi:hypothetical protein
MSDAMQRMKTRHVGAEFIGRLHGYFEEVD